MHPMNHQWISLLAQASQQGSLSLLPVSPLFLHLALLDGPAGHLAWRCPLGARAGLDGCLVQWHTANVQHSGG